ncbi:response regulator [Vibrio makurazakiensis]|uniref:sigma-54-dependent transcriptional regulator n=1 Tax=Vibrio makurazakiensis TaxID=2910250 RepID=UPI003D0F3F11
MLDIYFVDDEPRIRDSVQQALMIEGIDATCFPNAVEALATIDSSRAGIIITDIHMPVMDGIEFTRQILKHNPHFQIIVLTGYGDVETAVSAMKAGAYDFLEKPFSTEKLLTAINKARDKLSLVQENHLLKKELEMQVQVGPKLIGHSNTMVELRRQLISIESPQDRLIAIFGEVGTGKRITAQYLHDLHSDPSSEMLPIPAFEIAPYSETVFKDLIRQQLAKAMGGSLYIYQTEQWENHHWQWLESCKNNDARIIVSSSSIQLNDMSGFQVFQLPNLSQRLEDIGPLFKHFVRGAASRYQLQPPVITHQEISQLQQYSWSENIKQLRQHAEVRALRNDKQELDANPETTNSELNSLNQRIDVFEQLLLIEALHRHDGRLKDVQLELQISRKTLYDKMKKHQLDKVNYKMKTLL